jgi:hypothetical protein
LIETGRKGLGVRCSVVETGQIGQDRKHQYQHGLPAEAAIDSLLLVQRITLQLRTADEKIITEYNARIAITSSREGP